MKYRIQSTRPSAEGLDLDAALNPQQRAVVDAPDGKLLVLAGAGTGKTRTLTYRVARLVSRGIHPERIMLVTFTNRAAREMVERVEVLLGVEMRRCAAGTFHHVGNRILRQYAAYAGLDPQFGILDPEDARDLLATTIGELGLPTLSARRFPSPRVLAAMISFSHGTTRSLESVVEHHYERFAPLLPLIHRVATRYAARKRELSVCDFDDLLVAWLALLREPAAAEAAEALRTAYQHVLVDEYQDINALQGAIVDGMAALHGNLTCVGDDAQSIYAFRGADFDQIHHFAVRHPGARVLPLTLNYRSTPEVLALANRSIAFNREQHPKQLAPTRARGPLPALVPLRDVYQQAEFVAQRVLELHHDRDTKLSTMAVLYRNHAHGLELQVELTRRRIPYQVRSGMRFFEQAHVKDVVAFLRARDNPKDELAWFRLLRLFPGIGQQTAERVAADVARDLSAPPPVPHVDEVDCPPPLPAAARIERAWSAASPRARSALSTVLSLARALDEQRHTPPGASIRIVLDRFYADFAERTFENWAQRKEDLDNLAAFADRYASSEAFLSELALVQGIGAESLAGAPDPDDRLILSTIHQAKGLEWPYVFVIGLAEGRFPGQQAIRSQLELEEERRLYYVAVTRAADELYLCYPTVEEGRDGPSKLTRVSRFVSEIDRPPAVLERWEIEEGPPPEVDDSRT